MSEVDKLQRQANEIELAQDDSKAYGGGWLLVDPQGVVKRVRPPEVVSWAMRDLERRS